jgi:hypothetical protein
MSENIDLEFIEIVVDENELILRTDDDNKVRGWDRELRATVPPAGNQ